jgi:hypothetical protein
MGMSPMTMQTTDLTTLAANGFTNLDGSYATPSSITSTTQIARIRNSLIYKYDTGYASTYSTSDSDSIASYGLFERSFDSNIKSLQTLLTSLLESLAFVKIHARH